MKVDIRKIKELDEIHPILKLMQKVWNLSDLEVGASFEMKAVTKFGIVIGAYDLDINPNKPIGFIYGFPKFPNLHYSHQMGIDQDYQNQNVGYLLKKVHREIALEEFNPEIYAIEWTVDPLLGPNSGLNFRKLGVICNTYYPNFYGKPDGMVNLYPSVPTDRILVKWIIRSPRVIRRFDSRDLKPIPWNDKLDLFSKITPIQVLSTINKNGFLEAPKSNLDPKLLNNEELCIQIPSEYSKLAKIDLQLAINWRENFKNICIYLFNNGYYIVDFISFLNGKKRENFFIFTKNFDSYEY